MWCIGDGSKISLWKSPWIRHDEIRLTGNEPHSSVAKLTVQDIITPVNKQWDVHFIHALFPPKWRANLICGIPLFHSVKEDRIVRALTKNGTYTVRSAYYFYMQRRAAADNLTCTGEWSYIWHLSVPPKVKTFIWKACRDCLPTRIRLQSKGVLCPALCTLCAVELENVWHIFLTCDRVKPVWVKTHIWQVMEPLLMECKSFSSLFFRLCTVVLVQATTLNVFVMNLWSVWKSRKEQLWNHKEEGPDHILHRATTVFQDWDSSRQIFGHITAVADDNPSEIIWRKPPQGYVKCNVDAAFFKEENKTGFGLYLRDDNGSFLLAKSVWIPQLLSVSEGEVTGLYHALKWMEDLNLNHVIFEMDNKQVSCRPC